MLAKLFFYRRTNGDDLMWRLLRSPADSALALAAVAMLTAFLGHAVVAAERWREQAGVALLIGIGTWYGTALGIAVPRQIAGVVFARWVRVLPISPEDAMTEWQRRSVRRVSVLGLVAALVLASAGALGGLALPHLATAASSLWMAGFITVAGVLWANPWQNRVRGVRATIADRNRTLPVRWLEAAHARNVGSWQASRKWTRWTATIFILASLAALSVAVVVGRARAEAWPVLVVSLLVSTAFFNTSLDGRILAFKVVRLLPLSRTKRLQALVHWPACASLAILLLCNATLLLVRQAPAGGLLSWLVLGLAWLTLCMARTAACLRQPAHSIRTDVEYMSLLALAAILVQAAGPAGLALAAAVIGALLWRRAAQA